MSYLEYQKTIVVLIFYFSAICISKVCTQETCTDCHIGYQHGVGYNTAGDICQCNTYLLGGVNTNGIQAVPSQQQIQSMTPNDVRTLATLTNDQLRETYDCFTHGK